ncbi:MAG TPA: hypothetical protein VGO56_21275 [Pyrinomonadaceae bacterium]|jgi:hypothetical protein|nr:hypothetical protein [Pyrinomonadaceae bacterium]
MKRNSLLLTVFVLLCGLSVSALTAPSDKEFNKDGLSFNYPDGWAFNDNSDKDAQNLTLGRPDSEAQITVFVDRDHTTKPEHMAEVKKVLVDKYVANTLKSFQVEDPKTTSAPATSEIGGIASEGVKIRASLGGVPGMADIEWAFIGERLVVLTLFGPDPALKKATPAWDTIRNSIKIAAPQPKATPQPAASPKP